MQSGRDESDIDDEQIEGKLTHALWYAKWQILCAWQYPCATGKRRVHRASIPVAAFERVRDTGLLLCRVCFIQNVP
jgi:hypothetical protein